MSTLIRTIERHGERRRSEDGFVLVMLALMLVVLISFAGYTVDLGNWNVHRNKAQTASEAASLGGVAFLPDEPAKAIATAVKVAERHGFDASEIDAHIGDAPNKLEVVIRREVDNYFVSVLGMATTSVTQRSTAEFAQPVEMGSPNIILGNEPESGYSPDYWLSIAGTGVSKDHGDRFNAGLCSPSTAACSGGRNAEEDATGYKFAVRVEDTTRPLRIQVFDPAWVWVGSTCDIPSWPTAAEITSVLEPLSGSHPLIPAGYYDDAVDRYAGGPGPYCTGDDRPGGSGNAARFSVHRPDDSPWDDNNNPLVPGVTTCQPANFAPVQPTNPYGPPTTSILEYLDNGDGGRGGSQWEVKPNDGTYTFAETFRRWVTVCEIPAANLEVGDYIVRVMTTDTGAGQNRYALRAGPPNATGGVLDLGQALYARGRFPIFANTDAADISFFLARVPPSADERILRVTFFDIGDADAAGTISVVPPPDSNMAGSGFTNCTFARSDGVALSPNPDCSLPNVLDTAGYGEEIVMVDVRIPPTYSCDFTDPDKCWVRVRAQFPAGITDSTTWTAQLLGDAVRLVDS